MIPIIMPVKARLDLTYDAILSCMKQDTPIRLDVIFNGCSAEMKQEFTEWHKEHAFPNLYIYCEPQRALAEVWNRALQLAFDANEDEVLVINNDVVLRPDTARLLHEQEGGIVTAVGVHTAEQVAEWDGTITRRPHPDFSCFMIRKWAYSLVGPFDETFYPAFSEDQSYHRRTQLMNIPCDCVGIPFLHVGGGSQSVKSNVEIATEVVKWETIRVEYYRRKWGALWPDEMYKVPFNAS